METVDITGISKSDLKWQIEHNQDKCTLCGKCVAACTMGAIKADVQKRRKVVSRGDCPTPEVTETVVPVIKQIVTNSKNCVGCELCAKVCPNEAIKPVFNDKNRVNVKYRALNAESPKRGGRTNLHTEGRTLDKIKIGRISQMTDPSLDALRHTFELLAPFGRVLPPENLPFSVDEAGNLKIDSNPYVHRRRRGSRETFKIKIFKIYDFTNRIRAFWLEQDYKFNA